MHRNQQPEDLARHWLAGAAQFARADALDACDPRIVALCQRVAAGDKHALAQLEELCRAGFIGRRS